MGPLMVTTNTSAGSYTASLDGMGVPVYDMTISVQCASTHLRH
ncbi:MAG: hypothetical protein ABSE51_09205 [Terracidiphilus sp.]